MKSIFFIAINLMGRLNYTTKIVGLCLIPLVAITIVMFNLYTVLDRSIQYSQRQLQGIELIRPITISIQAIQLHRGILAATIGGNEVMKNKREAIEIKIAKMFEFAEKTLPGNLTSTKDFLQIKDNWNRVYKDGINWTTADNFTEQTNLIAKLDSFRTFIADEYNLTLDTDISSSYLLDTAIIELPHVLEHFGQLRAYSIGISSERQPITQIQQIKLRTMLANLNDSLESLGLHLDRAAKHDTEYRKSLLSIRDEVFLSARQIDNIVTSSIAGGAFSISSESLLEKFTTAIDNGYAQIDKTLIPLANIVIKERIAKSKDVLYKSVTIVILLFITMIYFSIGVYYSMTESIKSLVSSARAFANGDLSKRVMINTVDEIGQVGNSFNKMADSFTFMIKSINKSRKEASETAADLRVAAIAFETQAAMVVTDLSPKIIRVNKAFEEITGYTAAEAVGQNPKILSAPEIRQSKAFYQEMWADLLNKGRWSGEVMDKHKSGTVYPKQLSITAVSAPDGTITHYVGSFLDISARKKAEHDIHQLAFYDNLTKLPNRRMLLERLQHALAASARSNRYGAIMFIDLDNFKTINDTKGHDCGDLVLIEAARRLKSSVRECDTVVRLGGDEFVVMLEDTKIDVESAIDLAEKAGGKILAALNQPYLVKGFVLHSTASIGVNLFLGHEASADELLKSADIAMYQAKAAGRNAVRFFNPEMQVVLEVRAILENDLRQAIAEQQFKLYYQAQVDNAGRIFGVEALIRWVHPQRGIVPPDQFIPIAEEGSLILDIGQWVLKAACQQLALWSNDEQKSKLTLAVNVSAKQFKSKDFVASVAAVAQEYHINLSLLKLELTESMALDDLDGVVQKMHELKALGVKLSMDDFGTGYSSLANLKQLPLDQIKVDRGFISDIMTNPLDAIMVQTIIVMASNFGMNVIAEGVETEEQLEFLKIHNCMAYQGYLFSRPLPIDDFEVLLDNVVAL